MEEEFSETPAAAAAAEQSRVAAAAAKSSAIAATPAEQQQQQTQMQNSRGSSIMSRSIISCSSRILMLGLLLLWRDNANANCGSLNGSQFTTLVKYTRPGIPPQGESQTGVNVNKGYKNRRLLTLHKTSIPNSAAIV